MRKVYYKDGIMVARPKQLVYNGSTYIPPTDEVLIAAGYTISEVEEPEPYLPTKEELVERKLRERYSINKEFEVQRKRNYDTEAFSQYYEYVEECIAWANQQPHRDEQQ